MGYVTAIGACIGCKRIFSFHPNKVPSIRINGVREPICKDCVKMVNPIRKEKGLPPIVYSVDAYEVVDEQEINWEG